MKQITTFGIDCYSESKCKYGNVCVCSIHGNARQPNIELTRNGDTISVVCHDFIEVV